MAQVETSIEVDAPLADAWATFFEVERLIDWVDGFAAVISVDGYPEEGGTLVWRSTPAGRGQVTERVVAHEPRRLHRVEFSDPESSGTLQTSFEMLPSGESGEGRTRLLQKLDYRLGGGGPLRALTDALFIRSQMRRSLQRSLAGFRAEIDQQGSDGANG